MKRKKEERGEQLTQEVALHKKADEKNREKSLVTSGKRNRMSLFCLWMRRKNLLG
jgi:hypothetical protein